MRTTRRTFLGGAMLAPLGVRLWAADEKPLFRFGVMTDTHVGKTVESCGRVKLALQLFRSKGCELVINTGDIADWHYPTGYQAYRQVFDEVFAGAEQKPGEIYVYAWHDAFAYKGHAREMAVRDAPEAFEETRVLLKAPNSHTDTVVHKGYTFVVFPQFVGSKGFIGWDEYEKRIADACAANPGKPVFVTDHIPAGGVWGVPDPRRTEILSKFPQVVYFCGHAHGTVRNDLHIRQGKFTAISSGCLQNWGSFTIGHPEPRRQSYGVITVDVFGDRLDVRRWDVRDGSEILPGKPWIVPLPFVAETAPWRREVAKAECPVPEFEAGATVKAEAKGSPFQGFSLTIPSAGPSAFKYVIAAERKGENGAWEQFTWREMLGDWWLPPKERQPVLETLFEAPFLTVGDTVRFVVTPMNPFRVFGKGKILSNEVTVPEWTRGTVVLESADPAAEFGIYPRRLAAEGKRRAKAGKDGWYGPFGSSDWVIRLPEGLFAGKAGTEFRVTFDLESDQPEGSTRWNIRLSNAKGPGFGSTRYSTPPGKSGSMRYVMEHVNGRPDKRGESDSYHIYFERGVKSRMKPGRLVIERLSPMKKR